MTRSSRAIREKKTLPQGLGEGAGDSFEASSRLNILVVSRAQIEKKGLNCHGLWKRLYVDASCCSTFPSLFCRKSTFPADVVAVKVTVGSLLFGDRALLERGAPQAPAVPLV